MKVKASSFLFISAVMVGTIMVMSGDNWFIMWLGFELTLLGFIPLFTYNYLMVEGAVKYFIVQASGSALFILSFLFMSSFSCSIMILSLLLKLGLFPFYQWVPLVMSTFDWPACFFLVTLQKLAPLLVISSSFVETPESILIFCSFSVFISSVLGLNQNMLKSLMAYSSISHSGWVVSASLGSSSLSITYFLIYAGVVALLFMLFHKSGSCWLTKSSGSFKVWGLMSLLVLALAGLPPFSLFFLKVQVLYVLLGYKVPLFFMLLGMMVSIYYYLSIVIPNCLSFWKESLSAPLGFYSLFSWLMVIIYPIMLLV